METTAVFTVSLKGSESGLPYTGQFKVKTALTRKDRFVADERRRMLLGVNPDSASPQTQTEALLFGQLFVRILEAPKWWTNADGGLDLEDENVIAEVAKLCFEQERKRKDALTKEATEAVKELSEE